MSHIHRGEEDNTTTLKQPKKEDLEGGQPPCLL